MKDFSKDSKIVAAGLLSIFLILFGCVQDSTIEGTPNAALPKIELNPSIETSTLYISRIIVSRKSAIKVAEKIGKANQSTIRTEIKRLARSDRRKLEPIKKSHSVIFVVYGSIKTGDIVTTSHTFVRKGDAAAAKGTDQASHETFKQVVLKETPVFPLIIVNNTGSPYEGEFVYELAIGDHKIAKRRIPVNLD